MNKKALVVIDIQNDITKHYRDIIDNINAAIDWAVEQGMSHLYQAQQSVARYADIQTGHKGCGACPGVEGGVEPYLC